jgi:hypothetical protein
MLSVGETTVIPAGQLTGYVTISTKDLDTLTEILESIVFKVNTITNATATAQLLSYLERTTILQFRLLLIKLLLQNMRVFNNQTLEAPASKDAVISFVPQAA